MMYRAVSWCIAAIVCFGIYKGVQAFKNPWDMPAISSPVLSALPPASDGCGVKCRD